MSEIITSTEQEILIAHMVDRLPALRKKYGISQTELGEKIGLSRQTISAIERKTTPLTWTTMLAILMFFTANSNCVFYFSQRTEFRDLELLWNQYLETRIHCRCQDKRSSRAAKCCNKKIS